eukprot:TRINITY_DN3525_c0_g2_i1.p1 TRINITY_DN3525_c0_g2~~TRINITY_DN3525_c0_g2_i1.p1  ORF type:complete len:1503 (+),score=265.89 TRINITY_DN3525_c0_g2_i1:637-4509(+)
MAARRALCIPAAARRTRLLRRLRAVIAAHSDRRALFHTRTVAQTQLTSTSLFQRIGRAYRVRRLLAHAKDAADDDARAAARSTALSLRRADGDAALAAGDFAKAKQCYTELISMAEAHVRSKDGVDTDGAVSADEDVVRAKESLFKAEFAELKERGDAAMAARDYVQAKASYAELLSAAEGHARGRAERDGVDASESMSSDLDVIRSKESVATAARAELWEEGDAAMAARDFAKAKISYTALVAMAREGAETRGLRTEEAICADADVAKAMAALAHSVAAAGEATMAAMEEEGDAALAAGDFAKAKQCYTELISMAEAHVRSKDGVDTDGAVSADEDVVRAKEALAKVLQAERWRDGKAAMAARDYVQAKAAYGALLAASEERARITSQSASSRQNDENSVDAEVWRATAALAGALFANGERAAAQAAFESVVGVGVPAVDKAARRLMGHEYLDCMHNLACLHYTEGMAAPEWSTERGVSFELAKQCFDACLEDGEEEVVDVRVNFAVLMAARRQYADAENLLSAARAAAETFPNWTKQTPGRGDTPSSMIDACSEDPCDASTSSLLQTSTDLDLSVVPPCTRAVTPCTVRTVANMQRIVAHLKEAQKRSRSHAIIAFAYRRHKATRRVRAAQCIQRVGRGCTVRVDLSTAVAEERGEQAAAAAVLVRVAWGHAARVGMWSRAHAVRELQRIGRGASTRVETIEAARRRARARAAACTRLQSAGCGFAARQRMAEVQRRRDDAAIAARVMALWHISTGGASGDYSPCACFLPGFETDARRVLERHEQSAWDTLWARFFSADGGAAAALAALPAHAVDARIDSTAQASYQSVIAKSVAAGRVAVKEVHATRHLNRAQRRAARLSRKHSMVRLVKPVMDNEYAARVFIADAERRARTELELRIAAWLRGEEGSTELFAAEDEARRRIARAADRALARLTQGHAVPAQAVPHVPQEIMRRRKVSLPPVDTHSSPAASPHAARPRRRSGRTSPLGSASPSPLHSLARRRLCDGPHSSSSPLGRRSSCGSDPGRQGQTPTRRRVSLGPLRTPTASPAGLKRQRAVHVDVGCLNPSDGESSASPSIGRRVLSTPLGLRKKSCDVAEGSPLARRRLHSSPVGMHPGRRGSGAPVQYPAHMHPLAEVFVKACRESETMAPLDIVKEFNRPEESFQVLDFSKLSMMFPSDKALYRCFLEVLSLVRGLEVLNLSTINIQNDQIVQLCRALSSNITTLSVLNVSHNPAISAAGAKALFDFAQVAPRLTRIQTECTSIPRASRNKIADQAMCNEAATRMGAP